jgi:hypothetical protein
MAHVGLAGFTALMLLAVGCSDSDGGDDEPIVGSGNVDVQVTDAMFVETVTIDIPFRATVYDGTEREIRIEGEDNLIELIEVEEVGDRNGAWTITAPEGKYEQNEDMRIEIPFIDMVFISLRSADVEFADAPAGIDGGAPPGDDDAGN